ncbi:MAG: DUF1192 domain-containing protein [Rhizobiaceae bacterium]|nr:DUF1192 domain-containing protein [Rhizobiaceae bacterium]MCV0407285.1 DUF1192 domain-containing protein [Rhizobiaceae bacterium]
MGIFDDEPVKKVPSHTIGQSLATLSVDDLEERIKLLKSEISRLEGEKAAKSKSRQTADSIFRR